MISGFEATLEQLSIHKVGNKQAGEPLVLSEQSATIEDEKLKSLLMRYFIGAFEKVQETFRFFHPSDQLELNEAWHFSNSIFSSVDSFHEKSVLFAKHLYDVSNHPNIKAGELCVALFNNIQIDGELKDAIGIFKSESKESYLTVNQTGTEFGFAYEENGINIKKPDKACLIFDDHAQDGYKVVVIDATNRSEAFYWIDQFLKLTPRSDSFNKTNEVLTLYKGFVTKELDEHFDLQKADKIDMLNRSIKYFKNHDHFDEDEFTNEVIGDPKAIQVFDSYKKNFEKEWNTRIGDDFDISSQAVRKQQRHFKSVLKLDRNFHIYIHGDREMIEKGFDEEKNLNYYKVYFSNEQ
jgi:hypothetical protein